MREFLDNDFLLGIKLGVASLLDDDRHNFSSDLLLLRTCWSWAMVCVADGSW